MIWQRKRKSVVFQITYNHEPSALGEGEMESKAGEIAGNVCTRLEPRV